MMDNFVSNVTTKKPPEEKVQPLLQCEMQPQAPDKKRTWGNIIYDFPVFCGVAWGGVAALSAISAHESMYGKNKYFWWLRALNDAVFKCLKSGFSKTVLKNAPEEVLDGYANGTTMFMTLGMGGNALAGVIKYMEDNRQKIAAKIDNFLGTTPPDPETIENEPKQTWSSVIKGRLISWGGSYVAFLALGPKLVGTLSNFCGEKATNAWLHFKPRSNHASVRKWANIAAFDALFTVITATATYLFSRSIAKKDEDKKLVADELVELNPIVAKEITKELTSHDSKKQEKTNFTERFPSKKSIIPPEARTFMERANRKFEPLTI